MTFDKLDLVEPILNALKHEGYSQPTPIQEISIPIILKGRDLLGCAQTGTGKTAAFAIPILQQLYNAGITKTNHRKIKALIVTPTRELAIQIDESFASYGRFLDIRHSVIFGGVNQNPQVAKLKAGVDVLIATPGRLLDLHNQGFVKLNELSIFVLDEADRMFDLRFIKDIRYLSRRMPAPARRLNMLFSATLSLRVQELAYEHMNQPEHVQIEPEQMTGQRIKEELFYPSNDDKMRLLLTLMEEEWPDKAIVFANTKHSCEDVHAWLEADGHRVGLLTGDVPQKKRLKILEDFTKGQLDILVATDVAARGLHIPDVTHVFNYDLPDDCEDYVHRIGRTGRAGKSGHSISFACEDYAFNLPAIEEYIRHPVPVSKYDRQSLLEDIRAPRHIHRHRAGVNRPLRDRAPAGGRRRPPKKA